MNRKITVLTLCAMLFALCSSAEAQQPTKVPRIGYLGSTSVSARTEAFRQGLRELGYVEGKNIVIEWRRHEGKVDRLPALAAELVRLKVDIIITAGAPAARAAKEATPTIPIVMTQVGDPVGSGFVASLAQPGGNITGLSTLAPELSGKRLELLKEVVPKLSRVAVFGTSTNPDNAPSLKEVEFAAKGLGVKLQYLNVLDRKDSETAFQAAVKGRAEGLGPCGQFSATTGRRTRGKEPAPGDIQRANRCGSRRAYDLRREQCGLGPARRYVCRQNFERCQAG
jgi:putative ABC transport system substrate-binding protein